MKNKVPNYHIAILLLFSLIISSNTLTFSQEENSKTTKDSYYVYWGYNRSAYTKSNLRCIGKGYDFTMNNLRAKDNPEKFDPKVYFNPGKLTIPQFNIRFGYFFKDNWSVSIGYDHMKYVMNNNQWVSLYGHIDEGISDQWSGDYNGEVVQTNNKFIHYENSDGLNYIRAELTNYHQWAAFGENNWLRINSQIGISTGFILSFNDFNFGNEFDRKTISMSGYGVSLSGGVRIDFFNRLFIQSNLVGGMLHQLKVKTRPTDKFSNAKQIFGYTAFETVLGYAWKL